MLTEHQRFHLNAVIRECNDSGNLSKEVQDKYSINKGININRYITYLTIVKTDAENIIIADVFPKLDDDASIHDYLEKNRGGEIND